MADSHPEGPLLPLGTVVFYTEEDLHYCVQAYASLLPDYVGPVGAQVYMLASCDAQGVTDGLLTRNFVTCFVPTCTALGLLTILP